MVELEVLVERERETLHHREEARQVTERPYGLPTRELDPHANRYAAIIIPSDDYDEPDSYENLNDRNLDTRYLIAQLKLADLLEYPWSFDSYKEKWLAFGDPAFKVSFGNDIVAVRFDLRSTRSVSRQGQIK